MIKRDEKLREISSDIFQEVEPLKDRSRPLECRRGLNLINLTLKNIKIVTSCSVHDVDLVLEEDIKTKELLELVKADISEQIAITGIVDDGQMRDSLYFLVENKEEKDIFSVERVSGNINVSIKVGTPSEENKVTPDGLYCGMAICINLDPGDDIYIELTAPKKQLLLLITAIRADPNSTVEVGTELLSFTYEVDDAFREHYHPRDIILGATNPCFLIRASVTSKIGQHCLASESEYSNKDEIEEEYQEVPTQEQKAHQELLQVLLSYLKPLNGLVGAIWVLIIAIAVSNIFSR